MLGAVGLSLSFVPVTIGGLTGVGPSDAGVASGLINVSRQIGGAVGLAAISTVATTFTNQYVDAHAGSTSSSAAALTHGFTSSYYVLATFALAGRRHRCDVDPAGTASAEVEPSQDESLRPSGGGSVMTTTHVLDPHNASLSQPRSGRPAPADSRPRPRSGRARTNAARAPQRSAPTATRPSAFGGQLAELIRGVVEIGGSSLVVG